MLLMSQPQPPLPHLQIARRFYDGMAKAALDARAGTLPRMLEQFTKRGLEQEAEKAFNKSLYFTKRLQHLYNGLTSAPMQHGVSQFALEYFCCTSALNLYRLPQHAEQFKTELLSTGFFGICESEETEWLGVYNAELPLFARETGHAIGKWRSDVCKIYLIELRAKSSRDADTLVALRRFFDRQQLSKGAGIAVTPAMHETCASLLEGTAGWLEHYLKFHPF